MKCPVCEYCSSKVVDSRETENGDRRRRHECLLCSERFTTYEAIVREPKPIPIVLDMGVELYEFDREKLLRGLLSTLEGSYMGTYKLSSEDESADDPEKQTTEGPDEAPLEETEDESMQCSLSNSCPPKKRRVCCAGCDLKALCRHVCQNDPEKCGCVMEVAE